MSFRFAHSLFIFVENSLTMAIDTSTINQLISDFRALSQKDSISPESLGVLLKQLADLISSAAADGDFSSISNALNNVPTALVSIAQGSADRNEILMNINTSNLVKGVQNLNKDVVFIRQATTERAGAMRAQQVSDLNSTRTGLAALQKSHDELEGSVASLESSMTASVQQLNASVNTWAGKISAIKLITDCPKINVDIVDGKLRIMNHGYYPRNGYYAYVFRFTSKRNRAKLKDTPDKSRGAKHKGWHVIGGIPDNLKIDGQGYVQFRTSPLDEWHALRDAPISYSFEPDYLIGVKGSGDNRYVSWGKKKVLILQNGSLVMRRFRFAIGFAKPITRDVESLPPAFLASNLAEFSVIFDPGTKKFHLGK